MSDKDAQYRYVSISGSCRKTVESIEVNSMLTSVTLLRSHFITVAYYCCFLGTFPLSLSVIHTGESLWNEKALILLQEQDKLYHQKMLFSRDSPSI
ncbi:hypothetical protein XELAEV_18015454mg [Xenopus laevis]|uniref:Uncharacterized protein n=1 Tax=Xenopus laevis TaxID=8355 RepID=A0A974DJ66_XENLA|nr:hypothetical protein XELAEV_18015454mg [Xenopus laevis]